MKRSLLAAALSLLAAGSASAAFPFYAMDTCFKTNYPRIDQDLPQQFEFLAAQGYSGYAWTEDEPGKVASVARLGRGSSLKMETIYVTVNLSSNGVSFGPHMDGIIEVLKDSGTMLWLHITSRDFPKSSPAGDAVAVPALKKLAERAHAAGLRVAIYPHRGDWTERVADAVRVANAVDHPAFGVTFNLCHALMCGDEADIPRLLGEAAPRLFTVTINGADAGAANTAWQRLIRPLDEGTYDTGIVLRRLQELHYHGAIGLQGYGLKLPYKENLSRSMAAWRKLTAGMVDPVSLPFIPGLGLWRQPRGDWFTVEAVRLDPEDPKHFVFAPGSGVGVNGPAGKTPNLASVQEFGDVEAHVEFVVPKDSNSGVYFMGRYEVQILDSFGKDKPVYGDCGGLYRTGQWPGSAPSTNAARAPGEWQTYDVVFRAPRFDAAGKKTANAKFEKVVHNGVLVQQNVEVPGPTISAMFNDEKSAGPLMVQGDHGPVAYRNIQIRPLAP